MQAAKHSQGYSLVELMVAASLGVLLVLLIVTAVTSAVSISSRVEQSGELFENAQYLTRLLKYELSLAGFYGDLDYSLDINAEKPDICVDMGIADIINGMSYPVDGINAVAEGERLCGGDLLLLGSDVLLLRRSLLATQSPASRLKLNQHYMQTALDRFVLSEGANSADFSLARGASSELLPVRAWQQTIYYVSADNTFKRRRFLKGRYAPVEPLAEGVSDFQLEYGIRQPSQEAEGKHGIKIEFVEFPSSAQQWQQLVAMRFYLLLNSTEQSSGDNTHRAFNYAGKTTQVVDSRQYDLFSGIARLKNLSPKIRELDSEI